MLSLTANPILSATEQSDDLAWTFNSGAEAFDYLEDGDTLVLTYTITVTDDDSTPLNDSETLTITINGTNDCTLSSPMVLMP